MGQKHHTDDDLKTPFLFEEDITKQDRAAIFRQAAEKLGLSAFVVEKDYMVSLLLKIIFEDIKPECTQHTETPFLFKGGTTLSKVYGVINRMSEDIDLSLNMMFLGHPEPEDSESNTALKKRIKLLTQAGERVVSDLFLVKLSNKLNKFNPAFHVQVSANNKQNLLVAYPLSLTDSDYQDSYLQPSVLIETGGKAGFDPHEHFTLKPMTMNVIDSKADDFNVAVLDIRRTFFEKLTLLHELNNRGVAAVTQRHSRHLYDIVMIHQYNNDFVTQVELLETVRTHKAKYFQRQTSNWKEAQPGTLTLIPTGNVRSALAEDWQRMNGMFPNQVLPMSFEALIAAIEEISNHINL